MTTLLSFGVDEPIALGPDGTAPTELRLFRAGENRTRKGTFAFDDEAARQVMSTYAEMGRAWVMVDYDHGSLQKAPVDPSRSSRAAGTARLELRAGELWATNIRWTPDAKKAIEAGEWPSISPAFSHDEQGRPNWLINFGLTGNPATYAPAELVAANVIGERLSLLETAMLAMLRALPFQAYPVEDRSWDGPASIERVRRWASSDGSGAKETIDWAKYAQAFAHVDPEMREDFGGYKLPHHDVVNGRLVTVTGGVQAAGGVMRGARGGVDIPEADRSAVEAHLAQHYHQWDAKAPWEAESSASIVTTNFRRGRIFTGNNMSMSKLGLLMAAKGKTAADLAKALGIDEMDAMAFMMEDENEGMACKRMEPALYSVLSLAKTADDTAVEKRVRVLADVEMNLLSVTGEKSGSAALGVVEAWKKNAATAKATAEKLAKIEGERLASRVDTLLATAVAEKRIVKPEIDGKDGKGGLRAKGIEDPEWLEAHLSTREPIVLLTTNYEQPQTKPKGGGAESRMVEVGDRKFEQLSGVEQARLYSEAPEQYTALKVDWEKRGKPLFTSLRAA